VHRIPSATQYGEETILLLERPLERLSQGHGFTESYRRITPSINDQVSEPPHNVEGEF